MNFSNSFLTQAATTTEALYSKSDRTILVGTKSKTVSLKERGTFSSITNATLSVASPLEPTKTEVEKTKASSSGMAKKTNCELRFFLTTESFFTISSISTIFPATIDPFSIGTISLFKRGLADVLSNEIALMLKSEKETPICGGFKNCGGGKYLDRNLNCIAVNYNTGCFLSKKDWRIIAAAEASCISFFSRLFSRDPVPRILCVSGRLDMIPLSAWLLVINSGSNKIFNFVFSSSTALNSSIFSIILFGIFLKSLDSPTTISSIFSLFTISSIFSTSQSLFGITE